MSFQLPCTCNSNKSLCQDACQRLMLHPTSLPQEQAVKTKMLSVIRIQQKEYLVLCTVTSRLLVSSYCLPSTKLVQILCLLLSRK